MRKLVKVRSQPAPVSDRANRSSRSRRSTYHRATESHFMARNPIHAAHKPTAPTKAQTEPPPFFAGISHPAQGECDGSNRARKTTALAKTAAQATAPILTTLPQDRWSKYLFSMAGPSLNVIRNPVTIRCWHRHLTRAMSTHRCRGLVVALVR